MLGSVETIWDPEKDGLLDLDLTPDHQVRIEPVTFAKHGNADSWLQSRLFDLPSAYSTEAEKTMSRADAFMQKYPTPQEPPTDELNEIHQALISVLGGDDEYFGFWTPYYRMAAQKR